MASSSPPPAPPPPPDVASSPSSSSLPSSTSPPEIRALSLSVINRIAAGEVIHRPCHALKELLENALDAQSTRVTLTLKDGGLRLLQVADNGSGIRRADLAILCRRFTTSKISAFEDLQRIGTFGFRGEALASITHVARVAVTTMTRDSACAYRAHYSDGELCAPRPGESEQPRPCAGVPGTTVVVEDLFFNVPIRRAALRSASEEFALCADVVTKYAVHYSGVAFTCKKAGAATVDINTAASATALDNIRALYGSALAKELLPVSGASEAHHMRVSGFVSNLNYAVKRLTLILFVNGRLVDSAAIKQSVQSTYARHLPKHTHGWAYLSVELAKDEVDVNVHPTKREVSVLYEDELLQLVEQAMENALKGTQHSRVFYATPLAGAAAQPALVVGHAREDSGEGDGEEQEEEDRDEEWKEADDQAMDEESPDDIVSLTQVGRERRVYRPNKLVRTDARQGKLASFFSQPPSSSAGTAAPPSSSSPAPPRAALSCKRSRSATTDLTSVHRLLEAVRSAEGAGLADLFSHHTFVGIVDGSYSLLQHKTGLFLVHHARVSEALFYQRILHSFSTHPSLTLSSAVSCAELLSALPPAPSATAAVDAAALVRSSAMLREYWSLSITDDGLLTALPDLLPHYTPPLLALPLLLRALCTDVDWSEEERCLLGVSTALAAFYRVQPGMYLDDGEEEADEEEEDGEERKDRHGKGVERDEHELGRQVRWCIEHSLFPACRQGFSPRNPSSLMGPSRRWRASRISIKSSSAVEYSVTATRASISPFGSFFLDFVQRRKIDLNAEFAPDGATAAQPQTTAVHAHRIGLLTILRTHECHHQYHGLHAAVDVLGHCTLHLAALRTHPPSSQRLATAACGAALMPRH